MKNTKKTIEELNGFTESFPVRFRKEIKKIKELEGFGKKAEYIWGYYWLPIVATVLVITAAISIICSIIKNNYDTALYISYVNTVSVDLRDDTGVLEALATQWLGIDGKSTRVSIDGYYEINPEVFNDSTYTSFYQLTAHSAAHSADCYIGDRIYMEAMGKNDFFYDLSALLPEDVLELAGDRLMYFENSEGKPMPYGIDLSGLPIITNVLIVGSQDAIFSVVANAQHTDAAITVLRCMLTYPN